MCFFQFVVVSSLPAPINIEALIETSEQFSGKKLDAIVKRSAKICKSWHQCRAKFIIWRTSDRSDKYRPTSFQPNLEFYRKADPPGQSRRNTRSYTYTLGPLQLTCPQRERGRALRNRNHRHQCPPSRLPLPHHNL